MASDECVMEIFKQQTLRESKLTQLNDKYKVNSNCSEGKPMPDPAVFEKAKCSCHEIKISVLSQMAGCEVLNNLC